MARSGIFYSDIRNGHIPEILKEIYIERIYDPYFENKENLTILDVGANVGLWSQYAYPFAKVIYAMEPSKEHADTIEELKTYNKLDNITIIRKALSHKNGTADFFHHPNVTMYSLRAEVNALPEQKETVETIRIDTLMDELKIDHIDFLKLDCEGSECEIVGSEGFSKVAEKIDVIGGEYHTWSGVNPHQLQAALEDRGFKFTWVKADAQIFFATRI